MKILYILPYNWGGIPHYTAEIANAVSKYEEVVVLGGKNINVEYFSKNIKIYKIFDELYFSNNDPSKTISFKNLRNMLSFRNISIISKINPDIIHLTSPLIPPLMLFMKMYKFDTKYPIIYTKHSVFSGADAKLKVLDNIVYFSEKLLKVKKIVLHTQNDRNSLLTKEKRSPGSLVVIPHGTYSFFKKFKNTVPTEKNCILFFGRICYYKGLQYLIEAAPLISKEIPDLKVVIAGDGDLSIYSFDLNDHNSLFEIYNEFISDEKVSELFQRAELIVMPYSEMSGQSGVLNIALAFKKPVVASDVGGIEDIIVNGVTGFLVPPKDPEALAEATIKILKNPEIRQKMEMNMEVKSRDLSWDNVAKKHITLYKEILEN
jgi:glycosyltransferase involved in cell wall biosynthesis